MKQAYDERCCATIILAYAQDEIMICNGSTQALLNALQATLAPDDEVNKSPRPYSAPYLGPGAT